MHALSMGTSRILHLHTNLQGGSSDHWQLEEHVLGDFRGRVDGQRIPLRMTRSTLGFTRSLRESLEQPSRQEILRAAQVMPSVHRRVLLCLTSGQPSDDRRRGTGHGLVRTC